MEPSNQTSPRQSFSYFNMQAYWGVTKHMGGVEATDELAALCQIDKDKQILEVGCGTGGTGCHLIKRYGCQVTGVDISDKMIEWARKRAQRKSIEPQVQFRTVDAQELPFEDNLFDAVMCESVTVFPKDNQRAVNDYIRVTKAGGYIGMNEGTWIKPSVPPELIDYIYRTMAGANFFMKRNGRNFWRMAILRISLQNPTR